MKADVRAQQDLGKEGDVVDADASLTEAGVDSLGAIELRSHLQSREIENLQWLLILQE